MCKIKVLSTPCWCDQIQSERAVAHQILSQLRRMRGIRTTLAHGQVAPCTREDICRFVVSPNPWNGRCKMQICHWLWGTRLRAQKLSAPKTKIWQENAKKMPQDSTNSGRELRRSSAARFNTRPRARGFSSLHSPLLKDSCADFTASSISAASPEAKVASLSPVAGFRTSSVCPLLASAHLPFTQRPKWGTLALWAYLKPCSFGSRWRCPKAMAGTGENPSKRWKRRNAHMQHSSKFKPIHRNFVRMSARPMDQGMYDICMNKFWTWTRSTPDSKFLQIAQSFAWMREAILPLCDTVNKSSEPEITICWKSMKNSQILSVLY